MENNVEIGAAPDGHDSHEEMERVGNVLVVDDDRLVGTALSQSLVREGFDVQVATNVEDALSLFGSGSIDVVLTDLIMPGGSGIDLLRHVELRDPMIPVIIITADDSVEAAAEAVRERAFDYLTKPVSRAQLSSAVQRAVATRRKTQLRRQEQEKLRNYHRRLEVQNKRRSRLLSLLFNRAREGIVIWDHNARLIDASDSFVSLVGEPLFKMMNQDVDYLFEPHPTDGHLRRRLVQLVSAPGLPGQWQGDVTVRPSGEGRSHMPAKLSLSVCEMPNSGGTDNEMDRYVVGLLHYDQGHEERSRQLQLADRLATVGLMAGSAAHEIRNDLSPLTGYLSLLEAHDTEGMVDLMKQGVARIRAHVDQILEPLKHRVRARGAVSLKRTLDRVLEELARAGKSRRVNIEVHADEDDVIVLADKDELHQITMNLVINSLDALGDGGGVERGNIIVRLVNEIPYGLLEVSDDGDGIAPALRGRVFEPFFTTKGQAGTGLGLAVVHDIVMSLRGRLSLESQENSGTTVRVRVPLFIAETYD